tara:strand:+ start:60 stop:161 length:102 start_codon:yes stop_codon:yes gene_type:complete
VEQVVDLERLVVVEQVVLEREEMDQWDVLQHLL